MKTSIALVSAALLLGAAGYRSSPEILTPGAAPAPAERSACPPSPLPAETPSLGVLEALLRAVLPTSDADPGPARESEPGAETRWPPMDLLQMKIVKREVAR